MRKEEKAVCVCHMKCLVSELCLVFVCASNNNNFVPLGQWRSCRSAHTPQPCPLALTLGMCSLLTQTFRLMCNTQELYLNNNQIGDKGLEALSASLATGALARLSGLYLGSNPISDDAKHTMQTAMSNRSGSVHF